MFIIIKKGAIEETFVCSIAIYDCEPSMKFIFNSLELSKCSQVDINE